MLNFEVHTNRRLVIAILQSLMFGVMLTFWINSESIVSDLDNNYSIKERTTAKEKPTL